MLRKTVILLSLVFALNSCTVLQWRSTDVEILENFERSEIATEISYYNIDSLDLQIRVQEVKSYEAKLSLIFFHGSPSSLSAWNGYLKDSVLSSKANLLAVDRPGYGYSNFGREVTSIELQANIMSDLIDHYKLQNVIVVGSSYGGPLAARLAILNNRVKAVMMISPAIDPKKEKKIWASRLTQWWITRWMVPTGYRVAGDEKTVHAQELELLDPFWEDLEVPVVHIHGDVDDIVPYSNIAYTKGKFRNIKAITLPQTGHEIAWKRPDLIKPHLIQLIDTVLGEHSN